MSTATATEELIVVSGLDLAATTASDAARSRRDAILKAAATLTAVTTPEQAERAAAALRVMKNFTGLIESGRQQAKAPVLTLGKAVDELARELAADVDAEYVRVSRFLGAYEQEQKRIAEENRRKAWEEEQRIIRETREKERIAREKEEAEKREREAAARAEQDRLQKLADQARTETARVKRQAELDAAKVRADDEAKAAEIKAAQEKEAREEVAVGKIIDARVSVVVPERPAGIAVRRNPKFKVVDLHKLYEAAPFLVKLEPNTAAINNAIRSLAEGQNLPGIEHWFESAANVR